ncbi:hypothetical protein Y032_0017g3222 [Ancylostoma ceylanicum]|nr:hypothetical protein Y032_0017g3222 [Ancylostoma ceylanicum]
MTIPYKAEKCERSCSLLSHYLRIRNINSSIRCSKSAADFTCEQEYSEHKENTLIGPVLKYNPKSRYQITLNIHPRASTQETWHRAFWGNVAVFSLENPNQHIWRAAILTWCVKQSEKMPAPLFLCAAANSFPHPAANQLRQSRSLVVAQEQEA